MRLAPSLPRPRALLRALTVGCLGALLALPLGTLAPLGQAPAEAQAVRTSRLAGFDRYETAAVVSQANFAPGVDSVFIATGTNFPDALTAGAAARFRRSPVLLVTPQVIPQSTAAELRRLRPREIVVVGGTAAVPQGIEDALREFGAVVRIGGFDRFETSAQLALQVFFLGEPDTIIIASGEDFPDALSAAAAAGAVDSPVLLTNRTVLPTATEDAILRLRPFLLSVVSTAGAVGPEVVANLSRFNTVRVVEGIDRVQTSVRVSENFSSLVTPPGRPPVPFPAGPALVATGNNFPDALSASALGRPVLLAVGDQPPPELVAELRRRAATDVQIIGGPAAVTPTFEQNLAAALA